ncbi:uncharacterized protein LOC113213413 isoform X2 [Frankliniella occidentalis]|uniref:Uncharacterized protein LOC113213413 isoform X2 n=1 Tax=Frankliniella occidentalis TaxID=133901 RepID=A0A6J1T9M9_FRAOC|nr:uncharacterized protein LOC113213413 isoform X2 [Frankliniella occidentalis]
MSESLKELKMMACIQILLTVIRISFAMASLPPQLILNKTAMDIYEESFERVCDLQQASVGLYLKPWQEIPQHAQGCWVPYFGPQGHGLLPEEVHIVHITDINRVIETLPHPKQIIVTVNLQLNDSFCQNSADDEFQSGLRKANFELSNSNIGIGNIEKNIPSILQFRDFPNRAPSKTLTFTSGQNSRPPISSNPKEQIIQRPLVLLLTSDQPVTWKIKEGACWKQEVVSKVQAIVERESAVVSDIALEVLSKTWVKRINRKSIQRYARRTFHGVASFTQAKAANAINISVGPYGSPHEITHSVPLRDKNKLNFCDFNSREDSQVVTASLIMPLSFQYCVLGQSNSTKSFVIEIQQSQLSAGRKRQKGSADFPGPGPTVTNLPRTVIYLSDNMTHQAHQAREKENFHSQNVTIFLKSYQPIQWVVFPSVQHTNLNIVTSSTDIIDCTNNCGTSITLSNRLLPQVGFDLLYEVLTETNTQVYYFRVEHVTGLALTIEGLSDETIHEPAKARKNNTSLFGFPSTALNQEDSSSDITNDFNERKKQILTILKSEMIIVCGKLMLEVFLPAPNLVELGVKVISLHDKSCQSHTNGSHFILASLLKDCGSDVHTTDGQASVISNEVIVDIATSNIQSDQVLSTPKAINPQLAQIGVPIACGWNEDYVRSIFNSRGDLPSEEDEEIDTSSSRSPSIYQLELYYQDSLSENLSPIKNKKLVKVFDRIYVRAWMDDAPYAQAVMESCWINNSPHSSLWHSQEKNVLISGMCPTEKHVNLEPQSLALSPSKTRSFLFSFQILKDFAFIGHEIYVHCQIGVCLSDLKYSKGKPVLCVDPREFCLHQKLLPQSSKLISTAHQVLTRGPLLLSSISQSFTPIYTKCTDETVFPFSSSISMHMTVTIAICSFIIGIGLTASLWLIHHKTEPKQGGYHTRGHSLGSQSAVLGSSLSPHSACCSTNSQSVITS